MNKIFLVVEFGDPITPPCTFVVGTCEAFKFATYNAAGNDVLLGNILGTR